MNKPAARILVEVCVGSVADVERAVAAGADRLELCSALELGGLTPSLGLAETVLAVSPVPVVVMVRPRAGGFCYDRHEFAAMLRDAERFLDFGASGIVFGLLDEHGQIDAPRCRELVQLVGGPQTIFHRAFDFISDQLAALDMLIELGFTRVLTSGGQPCAPKGAPAIRELIIHSAGRIEVMPGGGIRADNVVEVVRAIGCNQVHVGAATPRHDGSIPCDSLIELGDRRFWQGTSHRGVSGNSVDETVTALRNASLR